MSLQRRSPFWPGNYQEKMIFYMMVCPVLSFDSECNRTPLDLSLNFLLDPPLVPLIPKEEQENGKDFSYFSFF